MRGTESNPWPAFADILFMLYVTTLLGAGVITTWAIRSEERLRGCGAAATLVERFGECLEIQNIEQSSACKVTIGEQQLRFESGKAALSGGSEDYARRMGDCLVSTVDAALQDPDISERLDVVSIDGFTDCKGDQMKNLELGAARASLLFEYAVAATEDWDPAHRADVLSRITVRSFGKNRPTTASPCASGPEKGLFQEFPDDRRVEVSFQSRLLEN